MPTKPALPLHDMEQRYVGLTKPIADSYTEAAGVCLDRHHESPTDFDDVIGPLMNRPVIVHVSVVGGKRRFLDIEPESPRR